MTTRPARHLPGSGEEAATSGSAPEKRRPLHPLRWHDSDTATRLSRDAHLPYLDWVIGPLLSVEARTVSELYQVMPVGAPFDRIDQHLIWRWLLSAERRAIAKRATDEVSPTHEQLWRRAAGHQSGVSAVLARVRSGAPLVAPAIAVVGLGGGTYASFVLVNPFLNGLVTGVALGLALLLLGGVRLRSRATVYRVIDRERALQSRLRASTSEPGRPPPDERLVVLKRSAVALDGAFRPSAWWIYLTMFFVTFAGEGLLLTLGVGPSGDIGFNLFIAGFLAFFAVSSTVVAAVVYDRREVGEIKQRWKQEGLGVTAE